MAHTTYLITARPQNSHEAGYVTLGAITRCFKEHMLGNRETISFKVVAEPLVIAVIKDNYDADTIVNNLQCVPGVEISSELLTEFNNYATDVLGLQKPTQGATGVYSDIQDIGSSRLWCQHALTFDERHMSDIKNIWKREADFTRKSNMQLYKVVGQPKVHIFSENSPWEWDKLAHAHDAGAALTGVVKQLKRFQ